MCKYRWHAPAHFNIWCFVEYPSARPRLYMTNEGSLPIPHTGIIALYGRVGFPLLHFHPAECVGSSLWTLARRPDARTGQFCSAWHTSRNCPLLLRPCVMMGEGYGILVLEMADYVLTGSRSKLQAVVTLSEGLRKREREGGRHSPTTVWWWFLVARWGRGNRVVTAVRQPWTHQGDEAICQMLHRDFVRVKLWP